MSAEMNFSPAPPAVEEHVATQSMAGPSTSGAGGEKHTSSLADSGSASSTRSSERGLRKKRRDASTAPLQKLSIHLLETYQRINEKYYEKKKKKSEKADGGAEAGSSGQSENWDYEFSEREVLMDRYAVEKMIGKGSFGQVVKAFDQKECRHVAIKLIKNKREFFEQAKIEIELLEFLNGKDPRDEFFLARLLDRFVVRGHQCLVFELLSYNLYDLLRNTSYRGVSLNLIRKFAKQILTALFFLGREDVNVIHCDLKPENILLRHPKRSAIKVIDFGSSCRASQTMYSYIQSRFYRSPEVLLGMKYGCGIDMWSLGCILIEMHTGEPIFCGHSETDQLTKICEVLGLPPKQIIYASPRCKKFFAKDTRGNICLKASPKLRRRYLDDILGCESGGPSGRRLGEQGHSPQDYEVFKDLMMRMLAFDPANRIAPAEALEHPFLQGPVSTVESGSLAAQSSSATGSAPMEM